jgi:site-specific recombinase XerD
MATIVEQWAADMAFRGMAPRTIECRTRAIRRLERITGKPLGDLARVDLVTYLSAYDSAATRATVLSYIRCFYAWAADADLLADNPAAKVPTVKAPAGTPRPAARDDVAALLRTAAPRERSMALLMVYAGMRCCEVAGFRPEHLTQGADGGWWVEIPRAKGGKRQAVPLPADIAAEVLSGPSWDVSAQSVQKSVRRALKAAGSTATPHQLRHFYGTSLLGTTGNLRFVQEMMRHASPATTARYTAVASSELTNAAEHLPRIA